MVRALIIPALPFLPILERDFSALEDYQAAVGGYIEPISIAAPQLTLYVNEEGAFSQLLPNLRATALWWLLDAGVRRRAIVVGSAVLLANESDSDATEFLRAIQVEQPFRVEVQTPASGRPWLSAPDTFENWFSAAVHALVLEQDWRGVRDVRVTPA